MDSWTQIWNEVSAAFDNNGDVVPAEVVAEIAEVGGPESTDSWRADQNGTPGFMLLSRLGRLWAG